MKKIMKNIGKILGASVIAGLVAAAPLKAENGPYLHGGFAVEGQVKPNSAKLVEAPLEIRLVEKEGTRYLVDNAEITRKAYYGNISLSAGMGYSDEKNDFRIGAGLDCLLNRAGNYKEGSQDNIYNPPSKSRVALCSPSSEVGPYYGFGYEFCSRESIIPSGFFQFDRKLSEKASLTFCYALAFEQLTAENGYVEGELHDHARKFKLADVKTHSIKVGIEIPDSNPHFSYEIFTGLSYPDCKPTALGAQSEIRMPATWFLGVGFKGTEKVK